MSTTTDPIEDARRQVAHFQRLFGTLREEVARVIVGQQAAVEGVLVALVAGGHCLLEGVPGVGKTRLVQTLAAALDLRFSRIQFTPDLMPTDIVGTHVLVGDSRGDRHFEFQPGPVFANVVLADEINRATPKTQSALLQAMAERAVTVARKTYPLEPPFFVLATQNPIEMEGTYPLPEAQLDRFFFKLQMGMPSREELHAIVERTTGTTSPEARAVATAADLATMTAVARACEAAPHVVDLAVRIVQVTHPQHEDAPDAIRRYVRYGASPRGVQTLVQAAKVFAAMDGRFAIADRDVERAVRPALRHRIILNFQGEAEGVDRDALLDAAVEAARRHRSL